MPLGIGIGIGTSLEGVGGWPVGTPTIAVVTPVTNPPHFDEQFDIAGGDASQLGDVARHLIDGVYDASYNFTFDGDQFENVTGNALTAGAHTAQVAIFRAGVQVSAWSSVTNFTAPSSVSFTTIFAGAENGWLYDPSDITKLFTDSALTTPVTTTGDKIGGLVDSSGKGNNLTQPTSGTRPAYNVASGRKSVYADSAKWLASPSNVSLSSGPIVTMVLALQDDDPGTGTYFEVSDGTDAQPSPCIEILRLFGANPELRASVYGNTGENRVQGTNTASTGAGERFYLRFRFDFSSAAATEVQVWLNGSAFGSVTVSNENTNTNFGTTRRLSMFARNVGGLPANLTHCLMAFGINRDLTAGEITYVEAQAAARIV